MAPRSIIAAAISSRVRPGSSLGATVADGGDQVRVVEPERCARIATRRDVGVELLACRPRSPPGRCPGRRASVRLGPASGRPGAGRPRGRPGAQSRGASATRPSMTCRQARVRCQGGVEGHVAAAALVDPQLAERRPLQAAGRSRRSSRRDDRSRSTTPPARLGGSSATTRSATRPRSKRATCMVVPDSAGELEVKALIARDRLGEPGRRAMSGRESTGGGAPWRLVRPMQLHTGDAVVFDLLLTQADAPRSRARPPRAR